MKLYESELREIARILLAELFTRKNISMSDLLGGGSDSDYIGDGAVDGFDDFDDDGGFGESDEKEDKKLEEVED